ncbi:MULTISPECIES: diaminopimelate decarboxylase [Dyella]|nr:MULTISPECIES: diaminopimelate decarboxylase [Dyella]
MSLQQPDPPRIDADAWFDGVDLRELAARYPTPFYAYSANAIRTRIRGLQQALAGLNYAICYAVKANSNLAVLQLMAAEGVGADIVSSGELWRSLHAGIPAQRIVFSGVGKTEQEMAEALAAGIQRFNVESADELEALERLASSLHVTAHAAVRINPDVDALTHAKISTGKAENKFGVSIAEARRWFARAGSMHHVKLDGLHVHIGSQMLSVAPIREALARVAAFWRELEAAGHALNSIDVGGGLGVRYRYGHDEPVTPEAYASAIRDHLGAFKGRILLEPGRYLVGEAGVLLTRVVRIKQGDTHRFVVLDAAMNDLLRPSLYDAWHDIVPLVPRPGPSQACDIVGPVCETGDTFARGRMLPPLEAGDLVMIRTSGAYGSSMSSTYNSRPLVAELLLDEGRHAIVRRRQTFEDMIAGEQPARWETV